MPESLEPASSYASGLAPPEQSARSRVGAEKHSWTPDRVFMPVLRLAPVIYVMLIAGIFAMLVKASWPSLQAFGLHFLISRAWNPITSDFGALPFIFGTVVSSFLALLMAAPVGIFAAVFLALFAPRAISNGLAFMIELLAAVPSVVYGLWGLFVIAPFMQASIEPALHKVLGVLPFFRGSAYGVGMLTAAIILAIMILPTICAISRNVVKAVPRDIVEGSLALGLTRWESLSGVILPHARAGIFGAMMLALGRALGETIATTMVIGNSPTISASLFAPSYTLSSVIANEFTEATTKVYLSALVELGLLLFLLSVFINAMAWVLMHTVLGTRQKAW